MAKNSYKQKGVSLYYHVEKYIRQKIESGEWPLGAKLPTEAELAEFFNVSLDTLLAIAYNASRSKLTSLISSGRVFVNGKLMENNSYLLKEGDVVTARGFGKFTYVREVNVTKKDKVRILIEKYE